MTPFQLNKFNVTLFVAKTLTSILVYIVQLGNLRRDIIDVIILDNLSIFKQNGYSYCTLNKIK